MSYYQRSLCPLRAQAPQPLLYDCSLIKKSQHDPVLIEYLEKEVEDTLVYEVVESAWGIILDLVRLTPQSRQHSKYLAPAKLGLLVFAKEIVAKSNVDTRVLASTLILLGRLEQKLLLNPRKIVCSAHCILLVCIVLTWKYLVDGPPLNSGWVELFKPRFDAYLLLTVELQVLEALEYELGFDEALLLQRLQVVVGYPGAVKNPTAPRSYVHRFPSAEVVDNIHPSPTEEAGPVNWDLKPNGAPVRLADESTVIKKLDRSEGCAEYNDYALRAHERRKCQAYLLKEMLKELNAHSDIQ